MLFVSVSKPCSLLCTSGSECTLLWLFIILGFGSDGYSLRLLRIKSKQTRSTIYWVQVTEKAFLLSKFYYRRVKILLSEHKQPNMEAAQEIPRSQHKEQRKRGLKCLQFLFPSLFASLETHPTFIPGTSWHRDGAEYWGIF